MYPHLLKVQLAMLLLVAIGSLLLGRSIGDLALVWITIPGAIAAFVLVDRLRVIELSGWVANLVSILVLIFTMKNFIGAGSAGKLIAVANLLAYLLTVLLFQKKTPRLGWQIMVLSVLQISVAAIFNLNFENGSLFIVYFIIATITMILQSDFAQWTWLQNSNKTRLKTGRNSLNSSVHVISRLPRSHNTTSLFKVVAPWLAGSLLFAFILFHSLPNTSQKLDENLSRKFTGTGKSWKINLDEEGVVSQTNALQFRAQFFDLDTNENIILNGNPYFRGIAMSKLVLDNGKTSWEAPYDHVIDSFLSYHRLNVLLKSKPVASNARQIGQQIILEPTSDPLLFVTMPIHQKRRESYQPEFNRDLSALTRRRAKDANDLTSFVYTLTTIVDSSDRLFSSWPYRSFMPRSPAGYQMEGGSPEYRLLTEMEPDRYPGLVQVANQVSSTYSDIGRKALCDAMVQYFSESNGYTYTVDYRDVQRDRSIDPVEDFFTNHKSGHCSMYASALTLMLRSEGIPARYVVGFHAGEYNKLTDCYVVHGRNAHAWVEAYLPPDECSPEMIAQGVAGAGGAWLTLDPTPEIEFESSNEALDLARSIWQDYVISPDHNKQSFSGPGPLQSASLVNSSFGRNFDSFVEFTKSNRSFQIILLVSALLLIGLTIVRRPGKRTRKTEKGAAGGYVLRLLGKAVSVVSADLANWVAGESVAEVEVPFYRQFERILKRHFNLERQPCQTHREFATEANSLLLAKIPEQFDTGFAPDLFEEITDAYYQLRFGSIPLDNTTVADIENQLKSLEQSLKNKTSLK